MAIVVTGVAGFIGFHVAKRLLDNGVVVHGIDNLNKYYSVALKEKRLQQLEGRAGFLFTKLDIGDQEAMLQFRPTEAATAVIHLAAQAGVRYSLEAPFAYATSNLLGHLSILEWCRQAAVRPLLIYASSSSVYGANQSARYREDDRVDSPVSLYAATKRADELMSEAYARLYGLQQIGLRFFTAYGPWGRPDMAYWIFTEGILRGRPIPLFNQGQMSRDFTFIDDVVDAVVEISTSTPVGLSAAHPHAIYNIGNNRPEPLMNLVHHLERLIGKKALLEFRPMQPGDVVSACADVDKLKRDYGFAPRVRLEEGLARFVSWFRSTYAA